MNISSWIASRLRIGAGSSRSARTGAYIAVAGVAAALAVMEFTVAVVGGFRHEIRSKVLGFDAEVSVMPPYEPSTGITDEYIYADSALMQRLTQSIAGTDISVVFRRPAVVKTDSDFAAVYFTAYDPSAHDYSFERECVVSGAWPDYAADSTAADIVLSRPVADALRIATGDRPMLYFVNSEGDIRARRANVAAIFESRISERDKTTAYASLSMLQSVSGVGEGWGTALEIRGVGIDSAAVFADRLQDALVLDWQTGVSVNLYPVDNVRRTGAVYLNWLDLLDTNVVVIFILMLLVSASTLVAALFIIILEHVPTIGLLRSLGASKQLVRHIFVSTAMRLVGRGILVGNIIGMGGLMLQYGTHVVPLDPEMYYIDFVPVCVDWWMFIAINIGVVAAAWLILLVPSRVAASIDPAATMRYE